MTSDCSNIMSVYSGEGKIKTLLHDEPNTLLYADVVTVSHSKVAEHGMKQ